MPAYKITYGKSVLMDVTNVTVTSNKMGFGRTALNKCGDLVIGDIELPWSIRIEKPSAFLGCPDLTYVDLPKVTYICTSAFRKISQNPQPYEVVSLPHIAYIERGAFATTINNLYLLGASVAELNGTSLWYSNIGSIFVRSSMYNQWITAPVWSYASEIIHPYAFDE